MLNAVREKYGNFPFGKFGWGSFAAWSTARGLPVKPTALELQAGTAGPYLVPHA